MAFYQNQLIAKKNRVKTGNAPQITRVYIYTLADALAPIFSDKELTTPITNPVTTDSRGYFDFNIAGGTYKLVIGNPKIKEIIVSISDTSDLGIGVNVLSNAVLPITFIPRDVQSTQLIVDFPNLSGTPGYTENTQAGGVVFDSNFTSTASINATSTYIKNCFFDDNGRMYASYARQTSDTGSFLYSDDDGATDQYTASSNATSKFTVAANAQYVLAGGSNGVVSSFDYSTLAYITTRFVGGTVVTYIEYDLDNLLWVAVNRFAQVYTSSAPTTTWIAAGQISGLPASQNYFEKTKNGYMIFNDSDNDLYFSSTILSSPSATKVIDNTSSNLLFTNCSNIESGNVIVCNELASNRKFWKSTDGGQIFTEFTPIGFPSVDIADLSHTKDDVWIALTKTGSEIYYSIDLGANWTQAVFTPPVGAGDGNRFWFNQNGDIVVFYDTDLTARTLLTSTTAAPTSFEVSALASPNLTDVYNVKGN